MRFKVICKTHAIKKPNVYNFSYLSDAKDFVRETMKEYCSKALHFNTNDKFRFDFDFYEDKKIIGKAKLYFEVPNEI